MNAMDARIVDGLKDVYADCGSDLGWVDRCPSDEEFFDVLCDLAHSLLEGDVLAAFVALPNQSRRALVSRVGP